MTCEYLAKGIRMSRIHEIPPVNPSDAQLKHLCNKIEGSGSFIEDDEYQTYCKNDNYVNCSIFKYMNNKCENLLLKETWKGNRKEPIIDLNGVKYKPMCEKASCIDEYNFIFCENDNYVNCHVYEAESDLKSTS
jgi:hypothetical protein